MKRAVALGISIATLTVARPAHALNWEWMADKVGDLNKWKWAAELEMSARYATNYEQWDDDPAVDKVHQGVWRVDLRGLAGPGVMEFALGVDTELGFEVPGGFVYGFHLTPLGLALRFGGRYWIGGMFGAGFGGVVDRADFAGEFPLATFLSADLGRYVRLLATARATWISGSDARQDGAVDLDWADEVDVTAGFAFGKRNDEYQARWSDGTFIGAFMREQQGVRFFGIQISLDMNGASDRGNYHSQPE